MAPTVESPDEGCSGSSSSLISSLIHFIVDYTLEHASFCIQDIYYLDADGSLFDAALLSAVAAFSHLRILVVSLNDEGRIVLVSEDSETEKLEKEPVNKEKRNLKLDTAPFSITCILHNNYILADPTAQEESTMETLVTVVLDSFGQLVSLCKLGGLLLAHTSAVQDCVALMRRRLEELQMNLNEATSDMEVD
ncbi:hypothetical protein ACH5RR_002801 [Cinchona calisaya]|uniref:Exoribonuclease phosphorolytic domain-containing protein n=1 Tax=Cinchona calisaya TaxID=153742 RepID=A0ABD3AT01_9GENT